MSWNGKIIGALIGLASGLGPVGALIGAVVGHQFDNAGGVPPQPGPDAAARVLFDETLADEVVDLAAAQRPSAQRGEAGRIDALA